MEVKTAKHTHLEPPLGTARASEAVLDDKHDKETKGEAKERQLK